MIMERGSLNVTSRWRGGQGTPSHSRLIMMDAPHSDSKSDSEPFSARRMLCVERRF
jgi:hypothetical protein